MAGEGTKRKRQKKRERKMRRDERRYPNRGKPAELPEDGSSNTKELDSVSEGTPHLEPIKSEKSALEANIGEPINQLPREEDGAKCKETLEIKEVENKANRENPHEEFDGATAGATGYFLERRFDELPFVSCKYIYDANVQRVTAQTRKYWMKFELDRELLDRILGKLGLGSTADHLEQDIPYSEGSSISSISSLTSSSLTEVSSLGSSVSMESFASEWSYGSKSKVPFHDIIEKSYSTTDERYKIIRVASMDSVISTSSEEEEGFLGYMMATEDTLGKFGQYGIHQDISAARSPSVVIHPDMQLGENGMNKSSASNFALGIASDTETKISVELKSKCKDQENCTDANAVDMTVGKKKKNKKKHGILRRLYEFFCICSGPAAVEDAHKANEELHD